MTTKFTRFAAVTGGVLASGLLMLGAAGSPAGAAELPGVTFYTGANATGSAFEADLGKVGVCQELTTPVRSFRAIADRSVEVYFKADCRPGAPGTNGDLVFVVGSLNFGDLPYPGVSYRVRPNAG
ncbi:hypothetical protein ADK76_11445 [Streptomyces griseoflavus]|uniref:hypothetical protein n=1 Tax=Streptomyces rimosus TaxID=1927 RepID=UPI0004C5A8DA|nr:hypothetical protein [Streptomyces rimosus]KOG63832.1 hypothetical protein ADK76_11445 [Streptomyces griseoflavus]